MIYSGLERATSNRTSIASVKSVSLSHITHMEAEIFVFSFIFLKILKQPHGYCLISAVTAQFLQTSSDLLNNFKGVVKIFQPLQGFPYLAMI